MLCGLSNGLYDVISHQYVIAWQNVLGKQTVLKLQWININDHAQMLFWFCLLARGKEWNFSELAKLRACFGVHFATQGEGR